MLPRPEGLPYSGDAKRLAYIYARARNRYKDTPVLGKDVGAKVRKLIDDHVISLGIDPKIPPIQLTDAEFDTHLARAGNDRAKASEMEHAIRSHIRKHLDEDPVLYRKLSERLNEILKTLGEQWNEVIAQLQKIIDELRTGKAGAADAPERPARALRALPAHGAGRGVRRADADAGRAAAAEGRDRGAGRPAGCRSCRATATSGSPHKRADQDNLNGQLFDHLMRLRPPLVDADKAGVLADKLMEQARANHDKLVQV